MPFLTPDSQPPPHYLIALNCIPSQSCMDSWVSAFRLEHQAVVLLMNACYIYISLCLGQPHLLKMRVFKAQNEVGWKLLGGSMLLELYVGLFWRSSCIFWLEEGVYWGARFVRPAFLKQFPDPQSRTRRGHPANVSDFKIMTLASGRKSCGCGSKEVTGY